MTEATFLEAVEGDAYTIVEKIKAIAHEGAPRVNHGNVG